MERRHHNKKRKKLAQNFLKDRRLASRLVTMSSIGSYDTVYEIGPGRGIITRELARVAGRVIAIEKDPNLARSLHERFSGLENVSILTGDFLSHRVRHREYKVFANIPYNRTADIVRRLLFNVPQPSDIYLIIQREPARKFAGIPAETQFSLLAKPFFEFSIMAELHRHHFSPPPDVSSVLLRAARRRRPLISSAEAHLYDRFVRLGFEGWKPSLKAAFRKAFTHRQWKRLARDIGFDIRATPRQLTLQQWIALFKAYTDLNGEHLLRR